ncbi:MAG: alanine racemase, partial [Pseudomonadota bacterium]
MTRPGRQAGGPKVPERAKEKRSARKEGATERSAETRSVEGERDRASSSARAPLAPVRDEGPVLEGRLTIDLGAVAENWRALDARSSAEVETAAVIKADAYGLG